MAEAAAKLKRKVPGRRAPAPATAAKNGEGESTGEVAVDPIAAMLEAPEAFVLPTPLLQAVAQYLATCPFGQVAGLMSQLQSLEPIRDE